MNKMLLDLRNRAVMMVGVAITLQAMGGCIHRNPKPVTPEASPPATDMPSSGPTTAPIATEDLGNDQPVPGLAKPPKPFIAFDKRIEEVGVTPVAHPSTLLLEHASDDSPVPLSEYARQPVYTAADFHLRSGLSAKEVKFRLGAPAQIADNEDPWLVYRLTGDGEIWLHFGGLQQDHLLAADVIRGAEDGYTRDRVFESR